ncbi:MAG: NUDIX domain-containing protein [Candidatus Nanohaloarchaea archaeon]|nr:NUDIX domain-containing protein [Candidatus Nanohaloarchaea archaeon]
MNGFQLAVKAFIVDDGDVLAVRRAADDVQEPGIWELPGGRLSPGEEPRAGLQREVEEETGLDVELHEPLTVRHFDRDDGQTVTMIVFRCGAGDRDVVLSEEHEEERWVLLDDAEATLNEFFHREVRAYRDMS